MNKINNKKIRIIAKFLLCMVYIFIIGILINSGYRLYEKDNEVVKWNKVSSTKDYTYIKISQMSEAFAEIKNTNKRIHFIIEKEKSGNWHTYIVVINKKDYNKYKKIIDYTYERTKEKPKEIKMYGYPRKIGKNIKQLAIKHIKNFIPIENKVVVDNKNFEKYLTNTYLDSTIPKKDTTNYVIVVLLILALILFGLIIYTIVVKDDKKIKEEKENKEEELTKNNNDIEIL